jgi:hypothetical protein
MISFFIVSRSEWVFVKQIVILFVTLNGETG